MGLHPARIALANVALELRRRQRAVLGWTKELEPLRRDGVMVVEDLLSPVRFEALGREVRGLVGRLEREHPFPAPAGVGFGPKRPFPGGFDRFDGATLNRFVGIDGGMPEANALVREPRLVRIAELAAGFRHRPSRFWIQQLVHGVEDDNPDDQKLLHRDTFHSTVKLWFFLGDVAEEDGPFAYVMGSHRTTRARYQWEYERALGCSTPGSRSTSGSFRIDESELPAMGLPAPTRFPVKANTLVIADVRGFHRRSRARAGARRLAVHASLRLWPFSPLFY